MFKKGLDVLNKTKEAAKASIVDLVEETEEVNNAKGQIKNMKWCLKLLTELSKNYCVHSDKQVQQGQALAQIFTKFGDKTSHTNYISNLTVPLSVSLMQVGSGVQDGSLLFQQYSVGFYDRLGNQLTALYEGAVKKVIALEKEQEEVRAKYSAAVYNLKSAQKSGKHVSEKQDEHDVSKGGYDQISNRLVSETKDMVKTVQLEVALSLKQFVQDQRRFAEEGIRRWTEAEDKIFGVESPVATSSDPSAVSLEKLTVQDSSVL
ncbi:hypothetical protein SAMD00019534_081270 [Acytostelium subglobosum LB1]|uniref:hypothetical protein n=1 Tax=Acytostelium subglobosum LB1 TaxID=1410327 RepID=UPI000644D629|nr:hypothetical protein SAMD00019534_081270 [Acytostelium subglobosum LB1]GAM24952.1 hypothetical protein SAMD00019534_081270 [Acytostelium subglobosum LB1]|eukprot:XP_012752041.1 hypothetical protein SAMD00019534_081270 [Acytostelium subglobosum LB1]